MPSMRPHIQRLIEAEKRGLRHGVKVAGHLKERWDEILISGDYSPVRYWAAFLPAVPHIMCSGAFIPETDFTGSFLQKTALDEPFPEALAMTVTSVDGHGLVLFTWLADGRGACERFVRSFTDLPTGAKAETTISLAARKIENLFFSPDWWEGLTPGTQQFFEECALSGTILQSDCNPTSSSNGAALQWENTYTCTNI